ncbi:MAG: hypothetical protein JRN26_01565 [Nitrososphaerota archaeon]|jgi:hypothetical protein|nr:hypothetical protein [Nitrososphaerota archaeon]MDG6930233.1 hypothetical protein [Nitrososphaerota archaeon]MDG6932643.1 hypothetical protein [Nitrososphaerota archaeon]MDG6935565.1 hypothetical protein [Nitrososphaerota archaeon]MDG6944009.1 hypothetical protein [Nitrososphaerota archaeon]
MKDIHIVSTLAALLIIALAVTIVPSPYTVALNYSYVTHDTLGSTSVNYTEYWTYRLDGSKNGVLTIIAYKTLRSYVIRVNASSGLVIGAYYIQPPHYNITFGERYYEPVVLLSAPAQGKAIVLLNSIRFSWKREGNYYLLYNYSVEHQQNYTLVQRYIFLFSRINGYLVNGTTYYSYTSKSENYTLNNQNILVSVN